ncbi:MAG: hypothetical protein ACR65O_16080 [Methylomicrobium sp.]
MEEAVSLVEVVVADFPVVAPPRAAASRPARDNTARGAPEVRQLLHPGRPAAGRKQRRPLPGTGPRRHNRPPLTGHRPSRAGSRLRRRIRPSGSNTQVKTSKSVKKDTLHGLARANKDRQTGRKRGSKPHSPTTGEATHRAIIHHRGSITMITTGTMAKSPPWRLALPLLAPLAAMQRASHHPRQRRLPLRLSSMRRRHRLPGGYHALPAPFLLKA